MLDADVDVVALLVEGGEKLLQLLGLLGADQLVLGWRVTLGRKGCFSFHRVFLCLIN